MFTPKRLYQMLMSQYKIEAERVELGQLDLEDISPLIKEASSGLKNDWRVPKEGVVWGLYNTSLLQGVNTLTEAFD